MRCSTYLFHCYTNPHTEIDGTRRLIWAHVREAHPWTLIARRAKGTAWWSWIKWLASKWVSATDAVTVQGKNEESRPQLHSVDGLAAVIDHPHQGILNVIIRTLASMRNLRTGIRDRYDRTAPRVGPDS